MYLESNLIYSHHPSLLTTVRHQSGPTGLHQVQRLKPQRKRWRSLLQVLKLETQAISQKRRLEIKLRQVCAGAAAMARCLAGSEAGRPPGGSWSALSTLMARLGSFHAGAGSRKLRSDMPRSSCRAD